MLQAHRRLTEIHEELLATCTSMRDSQLKLEQEKETFERTIKELMQRLYGRRSERMKCSPDQMSLDFAGGDPVEVVPDAGIGYLLTRAVGIRSSGSLGICWLHGIEPRHFG